MNFRNLIILLSYQETIVKATFFKITNLHRLLSFIGRSNEPSYCNDGKWSVPISHHVFNEIL